MWSWKLQLHVGAHYRPACTVEMLKCGLEMYPDDLSDVLWWHVLLCWLHIAKFPLHLHISWSLAAATFVPACTGKNA